MGRSRFKTNNNITSVARLACRTESDFIPASGASVSFRLQMSADKHLNQGRTFLFRHVPSDNLLSPTCSSRGRILPLALDAFVFFRLDWSPPRVERHDGASLEGGTWKPPGRLFLRFLCLERPFTAQRGSRGRSRPVAAVTTRVVKATSPRSPAVIGAVQIHVARVAPLATKHVTATPIVGAHDPEP